MATLRQTASGDTTGGSDGREFPSPSAPRFSHHQRFVATGEQMGEEALGRRLNRLV
jgi:hypothetical protein